MLPSQRTVSLVVVSPIRPTQSRGPETKDSFRTLSTPHRAGEWKWLIHKALRHAGAPRTTPAVDFSRSLLPKLPPLQSHSIHRVCPKTSGARTRQFDCHYGSSDSNRLCLQCVIWLRRFFVRPVILSNKKDWDLLPIGGTLGGNKNC